MRNRRAADDAAISAEPRPWAEALLWLVLLGPGFLAAYVATNLYTAQLTPDKVGEISMAWEQVIPFWPWSILPYFSIDLFYIISPFVCRTKQELRVHVLRFVAVTAISVTCFLLFPLRFAYARPEVHGIPRLLFEVLGHVDRPFNQAPSLHIALLVTLWSCYRRHCPPSWAWLPTLVGIGIACSVLTTWQHHFLDIPAGLLVGIAACLLIRQSTGQAPTTE